jgi:DNA topoisomerase-2
MVNTTTTSEFIDTKLIHFSNQSNVRHIPFLDGLKESQRKALWGILARGESADKDTVERIAAAVCSITDYRHGAVSMEGTIIKMAQKFAGTNNVPLFEAHGQFGNRLSFEPSASRYVKTKLNTAIFRKLFRKEDDLILEQKLSDGMRVEPRFFIPILPITLLNGVAGMGTGHATNIFSYNPKDIVKAIKQVLKGNKLEPNSLVPYWEGFTGTVEKSKTTGQVIVSGKITKVAGKTPVIKVTEIPFTIEAFAYKQKLTELIDEGVIKDCDNFSGEETGIDFSVYVDRETFAKSEEELIDLLGLRVKNTENVTMWDASGTITKFACVEEMLEEFVMWRMGQYEVRKIKLLEKIAYDIAWAKEKIRFIKFYLTNVNIFKETAKAELIALLLANEFSSYDRLLDMPMWNLTKTKIAELETDITQLEEKKLTVEADTPEKMYIRELNELKL